MKKKKRRVAPAYLLVFILVVLMLGFNIFAFVNTKKEEEMPEATVTEVSETPEITATPSPLPEPVTSESPVSEEPETPPEGGMGIPEKTTGPRGTVVMPVSLANPVLNAALNEAAKKYNCAAVSLAVFDGENDFFTYQYGYANKEAGLRAEADTKFRVASLSKLVTTICAMTLADGGMLDLDEDISKYLGYTVRNPEYPALPVTSRMLLTHTSSLYDSDDFLESRAGNSSQSTRYLLESGNSFREREPGKKHEYSNFGFAVLGNVCEMIYGKSLDALARDILFNPLGIDAAYTPASLAETEKIAQIYDSAHRVTRTVQSQLDIGDSGVPGRDHHLAQGNLTISALDYARVLAMLANGGVLDGVRILSENGAREIQKTVVSTGVYEQCLAVRYQEGAFLGEDVYWHTGSAYGELTQFIYDAETGYGVVAITTGANTERESNGMIKACNELIGTIWRQVENSGALPLEGMRICIDPGHQRRADTTHERIAPDSLETKPKVAAGTTGVSTGVAENELTLEVGKLMRQKLESLGAEVIMTRTTGTINISNSERAILANEHGCDMVIRIHADGSENPAVRGYSILVPGMVYTPDIVQDSTRMAQYLDAAMKGRVTIPSRGLITRDDLTGFNWLTVPGILIEMGYMTNEMDDKIMQTAEFQESLCEAVAEALAFYKVTTPEAAAAAEGD